MGVLRLDKNVLEYLIGNVSADILSTNSSIKYSLKEHHINILKSMIETYNQQDKYLCEMATGTGRTVLLAAALKIFFMSGMIKKALVIVDRVMIEQQVIHFLNESLCEFAVEKLSDSLKIKNASIFVGTTQFVLNKNKFINLFNEEDFDLIVFFGINQYISGRLAHFGNYFKAYKLGISCPYNEIVKLNANNFDNKKIYDTYSFYGKEIGKPHYIYSLVDAMRDGNMTLSMGRESWTSSNANKKLYSKAIEIVNNVETAAKQLELNNPILDSNVKDIKMLLNSIEESEKEEKELLRELIKAGITTTDIKEYSFKKDQLREFEKLLYDTEFFNYLKQEKKGAERVWQDFFEKNNWIFGYGLNFIFSAALKDKKLEQVISGFNFNDYGKRVDALMSTKGFISSLIFIEIKCHNTKLIQETNYRPGCWRVSDELSGAVSQVQKTVQKALTTVRTKTELNSKCGDPTGESIFLYQPKSFVVIGSLTEFATEYGVNEDKFSSFELFRRSITNPEIITYDELFNRAKCIIGAMK